MGGSHRRYGDEETGREWFCWARRLYSSAGAAQVREPAGEAFPYTERHLQCVWFDPRFRPPDLATCRGEPVTVEHPGDWNLEAGPDFLGAVVRVGPERRRMEGDVEVHIAPSGWKQHGHASDPRYRGVRIHVTYHPGTAPADLLPPGALQIELKTPLRRQPTFSFESIDVAAYPYAVRSPAPPCQQELRTWDADAKQGLLDAAGEERVRRKAERIGRRILEVGEDQALYEEVLAALGYKHNKLPSRHLALLAPWERLRAECADPTEAYAVLAGVGGLLPASPHADWDPETRLTVRRWWDVWWKRRDLWDKGGLEPSAWRLQGLRPANHPRRRLMAAAVLCLRSPTLAQIWSRLPPGPDRASWQAAAAPLQDLQDPFWSHRLGLGSPRHASPIALVGPERITAILVNVMLPFLAATGTAPPPPISALPPEADNQLIRQTAHWLFGLDHPASLYRSAVRRQGLLQIFHDFCLTDRSHCASCRFPELLRAYRRPPSGR